tara:strand:+ start:1522 stop:1797 length:276 start_codon:yes stop_codon:yes gene_type:complete
MFTKEENIDMSKEIMDDYDAGYADGARRINPNSIRADTPDWQEGYEQGLLAGYTKSIVLIRHLQRDYGRWDEGNAVAILNEAMDLIASKIK